MAHCLHTYLSLLQQVHCFRSVEAISASKYGKNLTLNSSSDCLSCIGFWSCLNHIDLVMDGCSMSGLVCTNAAVVLGIAEIRQLPCRTSRRRTPSQLLRRPHARL